jgi:UDP-3-O-[3-hydroxymyristoyl] glucosamine N-acyltransferase
MAHLSVAEIAAHVGGDVQGDPHRVLTGVAPLEGAGPADLSLLTNARYLPQARATGAGAVLLPRSLPCTLPEGVVGIVVDDPHLALAQVLPVLYPEEREPPGVHPTAVVAEDAELGAEVRIEPYAVVGRGARIGGRVRIGAHTVVGDGCVVGADTVLHPHVTLYPGVRVGAGCVVHSGARLGVGEPVTAAGGCRIGDAVEIGANTVVERGAPGETVVGDGTKMDNLIHVGPGARLGRHVLVVAQVGIAAHATVGDGAVLGGQAGTVEGVTIGAGARVAGRSAVTRDVPPRETVSGQPARPHREAMRAQASLFRLPGLMKRIQEIEKAVFGTGGPVPGKSENGAE